MLQTLGQRLSIIRTRHIVGLIEIALAWAVGIGPKTAIPTGAMDYVENTLKVNHVTYAVVCFVCGVFLVFYSSRSYLYTLLTIPIAFYVAAAFLRVVSVDSNNFASTVLYVGLYSLILFVQLTRED